MVIDGRMCSSTAINVLHLGVGDGAGLRGGWHGAAAAGRLRRGGCGGAAAAGRLRRGGCCGAAGAGRLGIMSFVPVVRFGPPFAANPSPEARFYGIVSFRSTERGMTASSVTLRCTGVGP